MLAIPHHKVPSDLSASEEPVYLGLDVPRAAGLGLTVLGTVMCTTSRDPAVRSSLPIGLWAAFLVLAFGEHDGLPAWRIAIWLALWLAGRVKRALRQVRTHAPTAFRA